MTFKPGPLVSQTRFALVMLVIVSIGWASGRTVYGAAHRPAILVLFVDDSSQSWVRDMSEGIAGVAFRQGAASPILYYEYLDAVRFGDSGHRAQHRAILKEKYADRPLDLVVAVAPNAMIFADEARDELWPAVPVLFASYTSPVPDGFVSRPRSSGISFEWGFDRALEVMKAVAPGTTSVVVVGGDSQIERRRQNRNTQAIRNARLQAIEVFGESTAQTLQRVTALPDHSIVFIAGGQVDADGSAVPTWPLCELVSAAANRPTFMLGAQFLGCGSVGGLMRDFVKIGRRIGERAIAGLSVQRSGIEFVPFNRISTLAFDARQLERWRIDEARLPPGSVVRFRTPSLWRDYRAAVLAVAGIGALQLSLIVGLLYERRRRRRAELGTRQQLTISAHLERQYAMGELAASMAHELNQPLGAIRFNVQAADKLIESNRASMDELREILADITREDARASQIIQRQRAMLQKRELEQRPLDLNDVVREGLAIVAHDAEARRVRLETELCDDGSSVVGDRILLQQVLVNLVVNAMDAMVLVSPSDRRVVVRTGVRRHAVDVSIEDRGEGIAPDVAVRLFDPFVTTKSNGMGIGLAIVRGIVEAHGGEIQGRNNAERGATFSFSLPASGARARDAGTDLQASA